MPLKPSKAGKYVPSVLNFDAVRNACHLSLFSQAHRLPKVVRFRLLLRVEVIRRQYFDLVVEGKPEKYTVPAFGPLGSLEIQVHHVQVDQFRSPFLAIQFCGGANDLLSKLF